MQEFLTNDKVSCNLMSLTGYRILIILHELLKSPKTLEELKLVLKNNKYIDDNFSSDTLRIYINTLRKFGCEITKATKANDFKFILQSHPFHSDFSEKEAKIIRDILAQNNNFDIKTIIDIDKFLKKLISVTSDEKVVGILQRLIVTKNIKTDLLSELITHCNKKNQIIFSYNSPKSNKKDIDFVCDDIVCKNKKLYLAGTNLTHQEYALFPIERILDIKTIKLNKTNKEFLPIEITCKIFSTNFIKENDYEEIIEKHNDYLLVKFTGKNEFELVQRILYLGEKCQVISPEDIKAKIKEKLQSMELIYEQ